MSDPKRYDLVDKHYGYFLCHKIEGDWVKWEDYARLKAEVERLTIERNGFEQAMNGNITLLKMKRAQVERLTKAIDTLIEAGDDMAQDECSRVSYRDWRAATIAAKKGGQP